MSNLQGEQSLTVAVDILYILLQVIQLYVWLTTYLTAYGVL